MARTDLVLLHAPSVYDFREEAILFGPISDVIPSTQIFEMYPIGFMTLHEYLERHGHSVRIVNIALRMLRSKRFDAERYIKSLHPRAFGIDLHWLVHAQGALELARIVKKYHPDTPVIFGGLSSSYFHEELIRYPQVDYVMRGDSTEDPLCQLVQAIKDGRSPRDVPNLTWKDRGEVKVNELAYVPSNLDGISFDYRQIMKSTVRHMDLMGHLPFLTWLSYPIVMGLAYRGCVYNCVTCGGSSLAYRNICNRNALALRDPEMLARDLGVVSRYIKAPSMAIGDILQGGQAYAEAFLSGLAKERIGNQVAIEFFAPISRDMLELVASAIPNYNIQISPESHDARVRRAFGRTYDNDALEQFIDDALSLRCKRVDLFFMIGLPEQTPDSVKGTVDYCGELLSRYGDGRLVPFISPLAPFVDPGSRAFLDPERYGYHLFYKSLEEHRQALLSPSWKYMLNYETKWMSRDELVDSTYRAALELNWLKVQHGLIARQTAEALEERTRQEMRIAAKIDVILASKDKAGREEKIRAALHGFKTVGRYTLCKDDEMNWRTGLLRFNPLRMLQGALFGR